MGLGKGMRQQHCNHVRHYNALGEPMSEVMSIIVSFVTAWLHLCIGSLTLMPGNFCQESFLEEQRS